MGEYKSKILDFNNLNNTRDLGGLPAADGRRIRKGRLIRSGQLGVADQEDLVMLRDLISLDVDFRTDSECAEVPDPRFEDTEYRHIKILGDLAPAVTRDQESEEQAFMRIVQDPDSALSYMNDMYEKFPMSERARKGYAEFVRLLLDERDGAILWHCTAGKDRAGFGTAIVLEILGVDREIILDDYLMTNVYLQDDIDAMTDRFCEQTGITSGAVDKSIKYMFGADESYLRTAYRKAEELYGDFAGFISEGLGITDEECEQLREMYLVEQPPEME